MATNKKAPGTNLPEQTMTGRTQALIAIQNWRGLRVVKKWPRPRPGPPTPAQQAARDNFKTMVTAQADAMPLDVASAHMIATGSLYTYRDVLARAMVGRLFRIAGIPDMTIQSELDTISDIVGSILVRGPDGWVGLLPQSLNQVLTLQGTPLLPLWENAQGGGGGGLSLLQINKLTVAQDFPSTPTTYTAITDLQITVGPFATDTTLWSNYLIATFPSHCRSSLRFSVASQIIVVNNNLGNTDGQQVMTLPLYPYTVPGDGNTHTIGPYIQAQASTGETKITPGSFHAIYHIAS